MQSKVWSTVVAFNLLSLWITINLLDQDLIAHVIAGANINLDHFCNNTGPTAEQWGRNIAFNPYSSSKFFHFIIQTLIEVVLGIRKVRNKHYCQPGAFGII